MNLTDAQITRIVYSSWDFQQALSAVTFLLEECDFKKSYSPVELRRFRCYETTLIISMARPFETSRKGTTINLGALRIKLSPEERQLLDNVMALRRTVIAHSDEAEMHFVSGAIPVLEGAASFPYLRFDETLHLEEAQLRAAEALLFRLKEAVAQFVFTLTQEAPTRIAKRRVPAMRGQSVGGG